MQNIREMAATSTISSQQGDQYRPSPGGGKQRLQKKNPGRAAEKQFVQDSLIVGRTRKLS
jgi:hypothetical protein